MKSIINKAGLKSRTKFPVSKEFELTLELKVQALITEAEERCSENHRRMLLGRDL